MTSRETDIVSEPSEESDAERSRRIRSAAPRRRRTTRTGAAAEAVQTSTRRISDLVRASIRHGDIGLRDALPEEVLVQRLDTSRNAVRQALQSLAEQGMVVRRQRVGTSVSAAIVTVGEGEVFPLLVDDHGIGRLAVRRIDDRNLPGVQFLVEKLGTIDGDLRLVEDVVSLDGRPMAVAVSYCGRDANLVASTRGVTDVASTFEVTYGVPLGSIESSVESLPCDLQTARLLEIAEGDPVLVREMVLRDVDGRVRGICYVHYRGGAVSIRSVTTVAGQTS